MKITLKLPKLLIPYENDNLIRIGESSDGSYLVDKKSVTDSDLLISIGVGTIFNFEKSFLKLNKVPLLAFDGSAGLLSQLKKIKWRLRQIVKLKNKEYFLDSFQYFLAPFTFYLFYKNFREKKLNKNYRKFIKKYVGNQNEYISFSELFKKYNITDNYNKIFFQIDIEGGEYDILIELIKYQNRISGLVIEFHNIDHHIEEISEFIKKFKLNLIHNHINNIGGFNEENIPKVIELTFSNSLVYDKIKKLPHPLDKPNSDDFFNYEIINR